MVRLGCESAGFRQQNSEWEEGAGVSLSPRFSMQVSTYGLWSRNTEDRLDVLARRLRRACLETAEQLAYWMHDGTEPHSQQPCPNLVTCGYETPVRARAHRDRELLVIRLVARLGLSDPTAVSRAYLHGATWHQIATAAGVPLEEARRRWLIHTPTDPDAIDAPLAR